MHEEHWLIGKGISNQSALAEILGKGTVTPKVRVRAHRIWHGARPGDEDLILINAATNGKVSPNDFILPAKQKKARK